MAAIIHTIIVVLSSGACFEQIVLIIVFLSGSCHFLKISAPVFDLEFLTSLRPVLGWFEGPRNVALVLQRSDVSRTSR